MLQVMLDLKYIKDNRETVKINTQRRNVKADVDMVVSLYDERINVIQKLENLRQERNENAQKLKHKLTDQERQSYIEAGKKLKTDRLPKAHTAVILFQIALKSNLFKILRFQRDATSCFQRSDSSRWSWTRVSNASMSLRGISSFSA